MLRSALTLDGLSSAAIAASGNIGDGMFLWIKSDETYAAFVEAESRYGNRRSRIQTTMEIAKELVDSGYLVALNEHTIKQRLGWRDMAIQEGETGKVYAFAQ